MITLEVLEVEAVDLIFERECRADVRLVAGRHLCVGGIMIKEIQSNECLHRALEWLAHSQDLID